MNNLKKDEYIKCLRHMSIFLNCHYFTTDQLHDLYDAAMQMAYNCEHELGKNNKENPFEPKGDLND